MSNKSITLDQYLSILSKDVKDKMVLLQESIISIYPQVKK